jgi:hypothetical protein
VVLKLLRSVSEWHVLLTDFNFPPDSPRRVQAALLTSEGNFYQGTVSSHFLDAEGALSGLFLHPARRFDRQGYLADKEKVPATTADRYWRTIPGVYLYVPAEKIISLNLSYPTLEMAAERATSELKEAQINVRVEEANSEGDT